jgi:hypothetical protein
MASRRVNLSSANTSQILADSLLDFMNDSFYPHPNEAGSLLISNSSIDNCGYSWKGDFSQLKRFVRNDLNLPGSWSSPGGDRKVFRCGRLEK